MSKINTNAPIGDIIRQIREGQRYSQAYLAGKVDISRNHMSEIESGKGDPSLKILKEILFELGYRISVCRIKRETKRPPKAIETHVDPPEESAEA